MMITSLRHAAIYMLMSCCRYARHTKSAMRDYVITLATPATRERYAMFTLARYIERR